MATINALVFVSIVALHSIAHSVDTEATSKRRSQIMKPLVRDHAVPRLSAPALVSLELTRRLIELPDGWLG